jgi:hypothetical protein
MMIDTLKTEDAEETTVYAEGEVLAVVVEGLL